jgi:hypothetical protein
MSQNPENPTADRRTKLRAALTNPAPVPAEPQRRVPRYDAPATPRFTRATPATEAPPWQDEAVHVPALPSTAASYVYIAEEEIGGNFVGTRIKLDASGKFASPRDGTWLREDASFVVTGTVRAWVHFENGRPVETIPYSVNYPKRSELDPPPPKDKNKEVDAWADTAYLMLVDYETSDEYTFHTSGQFGRGAVNRLSHQIIEKQRTMPGARALIQLRARKHERTGLRPFFAPIFEVCGWEMPNGEVV